MSDLAAKLRVTAAALQCPARKDLCARFRAVNPATPFDLERSHKWLQGRARPRSPQMYEDWARVLGTARSAAWLAGCTIEAFIEEVAQLLDADPATLRQAAAIPARPAAPIRARAPADLPSGLYACYSLAWSPYYAGHLIRGGLALGTDPGGVPEARYVEAVAGGTICFTGSPEVTSRTLSVLLHEAQDGLPLFLCLHRPGLPEAGLCGIIAGSTLLAEDRRPSCGRFAAIRVREDAPVEATNRYLPAERAAIADDLVALGLDGAEVAEVAGVVCELLLATGHDQVATAEQMRLGEAAARLWLRAGDRAGTEAALPGTASQRPGRQMPADAAASPATGQADQSLGSSGAPAPRAPRSR